MALALIALDCDGVILETVDAKEQAFRRIAAPFGPEASDRIAVYHRLHGGVSRYEKIRWLYREYTGRDGTPEEVEAMAARFVNYCLETVLRAPLVPGMREVLDTWSDRVPIYVCSGTPQAELEMVLEKHGLSRYFRGICGTPPAKAALLQRIVTAEGADPAETVMVGDSGTDREAAEIVGTLFYGRGSDFAASGLPWGEDLRGLNAWLATVAEA